MIVVVFLAVAAGFIVLGIIFLSGKGADLIAGYNTASPEEKAGNSGRSACVRKCSFTAMMKQKKAASALEGVRWRSEG